MLRWWGRWQDLLLFLLGVWLFISPWVLGFAYSSPYTAGQSAAHRANPWNDWAAGIIILGVAAWALAITWGYWIEFLLMALGIWVFISPWVLGFSDQPRVAWDNWITGAVVFLLALWAWWTMARPRARRRAARRARREGDRSASA